MKVVLANKTLSCERKAIKQLSAASRDQKV